MHVCVCMNISSTKVVMSKGTLRSVFVMIRSVDCHSQLYVWIEICPPRLQVKKHIKKHLGRLNLKREKAFPASFTLDIQLRLQRL